MRDVIIAKRADIAQREHDERRELLREHHAKFRAERLALAEECVAAGGHYWYELPNNGINAPHFITGEWPMACEWCGTGRRFGWTEADKQGDAA